MKTRYLLITILLTVLLACSDENSLFEIMPESDLIALEGMDEAYDEAINYNDLMIHCLEDGDHCDQSVLLEYDRLFHQADEMYDLHHNNYSHNNVDDDHHHDGDHYVRHGWVEHHEEDGHMGDGEQHEEEEEHNEEEEHQEGHDYMHDFDTYSKMLKLREMHKSIHPQ